MGIVNRLWILQKLSENKDYQIKTDVIKVKKKCLRNSKEKIPKLLKPGRERKKRPLQKKKRNKKPSTMHNGKMTTNNFRKNKPKKKTLKENVWKLWKRKNNVRNF